MLVVQIVRFRMRNGQDSQASVQGKCRNPIFQKQPESALDRFGILCLNSDHPLYREKMQANGPPWEVRNAEFMSIGIPEENLLSRDLLRGFSDPGHKT
jgi:hypothetical protein